MGIRRKLKKVVEDMLKILENAKERKMFAVLQVDLPLLVNQKILCVKKIWAVNVWIRRKLKKIVKDMLRSMENVKERRMYAVWEVDLPLLVNQKILCVKKIWVVNVWIRRKLKKIVKDMLRSMENVKERRMYA